MAQPKKSRLALVALTIVILAVALVGLSLARGSEHRVAFKDSSVSLISPIGGRVLALVALNGSQVQSGQVIAELDSSGLRTELQQAEAELAAVQQQGQSAIKPMTSYGLAGFLPRALPQVEHVRVPVQTAGPMPVATMGQLQLQGHEGYKGAVAHAADDRKTLEKATSELSAANGAVSQAQKDRDALRPKVAKAEAESATADRKAGNSKELLDAGVISTKRAAELVADKESTKKAWDALAAQAQVADKYLIDANAAQSAAKDKLDRARAALETADSAVTKAQSLVTPATPKTADSKPQVSYVGKVVTRRSMVRVVEPQPIPVKVFVDEGAMKSTDQRVAGLQKKIADLKAQIEDCKILAPVDGRVAWFVQAGQQVAAKAAVAVIRP